MNKNYLMKDPRHGKKERKGENRTEGTHIIPLVLLSVNNYLCTWVLYVKNLFVGNI